MKEISMTKAISCMPDKFITMEMVELAATEHRPELVNYLPEKYITSLIPQHYNLTLFISS